jgi:hypothetical protein
MRSYFVKIIYGSHINVYKIEWSIIKKKSYMVEWKNFNLIYMLYKHTMFKFPI